jgi:hypothetical protein
MIIMRFFYAIVNSQCQLNWLDQLQWTEKLHLTKGKYMTIHKPKKDAQWAPLNINLSY